MLVGAIVNELYVTYGRYTASVFQKSLEASKNGSDEYDNMEPRIRANMQLGINNVIGQLDDMNGYNDLSEIEKDMLWRIGYFGE